MLLTRRWAQIEAPAVLALAPLAVMRVDARAPAVLAPAPDAVMRADARAHCRIWGILDVGIFQQHNT